MKRALLVINAVGACLFGLVLAGLTLAPGHAERALRDEATKRVVARVVQQYPALAAAPWTRKLGRALESERERMRASDQSLTAASSEQLYQQLRSLCRYDCDDDTAHMRAARAMTEQTVRGLIPERALPSLASLRSFGAGHYRVLMSELIGDLRSFAGSNCALFLVATLAAWRSSSGWRALALSGILAASALVASSFYLFRQNWLQTLLLSDFVGYGYVVWVMLMAAVLSDIAFNGGRIFSRVVAQLPGAFVPSG
jgi:hypothetical protein